MGSNDGMNYAPKGVKNEVVKPGEFNVAITALDHGHIVGMANGLVEAGAVITKLYDHDEERVKDFVEQFPASNIEIVDSLDDILNDDSIQMVAAAAVPNKRSSIGNQVMRAGKDYFTDKTGFTTLEQLEETKQVVKETGQRYFVYFSERIHVESAVLAGQLIEEGAIGDVIQVTGFGPHRLNKESRPDWFFNREEYGGILTDIGSHQIEQFLYYTKNTDAKVLASKIANYNNPLTPDLDDYGDATLVGENGANFFFKVDWFTPDGLDTWGDGRTFITGTEGTIEIRKYIDVGRENTKDHLYLVTKEGTKHIHAEEKVGFPFFGEMILDSLNKTENAMTQEHIFKAQELCLIAQKDAIKINVD